MQTTDLHTKFISLIDLTTLSDDDTPQLIEQLCQKAQTVKGNVAAVCFYPQFVALAKEKLQGTGIKVATVANFPKAQDDLDSVIKEITQSIKDGADEIDVVTPYHLYLNGDGNNAAKQFLQACRECCGKQADLKVILESGALQDPALIAKASNDALDAGADFLKTSTGKVAIGATPEAAMVMLNAIKQSGKDVGFKASGGVRTADDAMTYYQMAVDIMGEAWVTPSHLRFGASSLLDNLL